jgi:hypothetical protein
MKILYTVPFILFASCDSKEVKNLKKTLTSYEATDSLLQKSKDRMVEVSKIAGKSDSVITVKVDKTVNKIQNLNHEVKVLKKENRELRSRLGNDDDGRFKLLPIDKSSSTVDQSIDVDITAGSEPTE